MKYGIYLLLVITFLLSFSVSANNPDVSKLKTLQRHMQSNSSSETMRVRFAQVASGIDLSSLESRGAKDKGDLVSEMKDLATPLIQSIKRISEQPRKIEELKGKVAVLEDQMTRLGQSRQAIKNMMAIKSYSPFKKELLRTIRWLENKHDELSLELDSSKNTLAKLQNQKRSVIDTISDILATFFKTKGKNLLLAILGFITIILGMTFVRNKIFGMALFSNQLDFLRKPLLALYSLVTFVMAIISAVICLYVLNDWLLVTITIFVLMGLAWSLKNYIPQFFDEIKLILNFGAVREGEKIYLDGIPWKVEKLSFYSKLSNNSLEGGTIRISSKKILDLHSRRVSPNEPWFPTQKGDWILIDGSTLGQVMIQTPDQIIIDKIGGGQIHYSCSDFIALNIENLNSGYSLTGSFGVDYELQKDFSGNLMKYFENGFSDRLNAIDGIDNVSVDFNDCGADSLNIFVRIDCQGRVASKYGSNKRAMQKTFLNLCNDRDYPIPFKQLTVHLNSNE